MIPYVLAAWLACGGPDAAVRHADPVAVAPPWAAYDLPLEGGAVTRSDAGGTTVRYAGAQAATVAARYDAAFEAAGHELDPFASEAEGNVHHTWIGSERTVVVTTQQVGDDVEVTLSELAW